MKKLTIEQLTNTNLGNTLQEDLDIFLQHHHSCGHSPATQDAYRYHVESFNKYLASIGIESCSDITEMHLRDHLGQMRDKGLKPTTIHGRYRHLKAYSQFLIAQGVLGDCPFRGVKSPKKSKVIHPALSLDDVKTLTSSINTTTVHGVRDTAIFLTLLDTALRANELLGLTCGQIDTATGVIKVTGKGKKDRFVKLGTRALRALGKWIRVRQGDDGDPLWIGSRGELGEWGLRMMFVRMSKRTDVHVHPHKLRRTSALMMLRSGMDLVTLSKYMGHASIDTTRLYLALDDSDIVRAHTLHSPVDGLAS